MTDAQNRKKNNRDNKVVIFVPAKYRFAAWQYRLKNKPVQSPSRNYTESELNRLIYMKGITSLIGDVLTIDRIWKDHMLECFQNDESSKFFKIEDDR